MSSTPSPIDLAFLRDPQARRRIAAVTLAFAVAGAAYALFAPRWYRSSLTVVPAKSQKGGGLSSMLNGELGGLAAGLGASMGEGADVQRVSAVLQSNDVSDSVIAKFDLKRRYGEKYQESAREALWKHCDVKVLPKPSLVQLSCEDKDPVFIQQLLEHFAEYGNQVFRRVSVSSASEQVRFLEKRVGELRATADDTAQRMREFQEKHQIVDIDTQTKAVVSAMAALQSQRISKQLELDYARTFSAGDEATLQQLRSQLNVMDTQLRDLEAPAAVGGAGGAAHARAPRNGNGMFPAALSVPKLRAEFETLYRDRKVAEATLVFALERLESARADEARDTSTFVVLDPPALPTRPARPKRVAVLGSLLLGLTCGAGLEWWRASRRAVHGVGGAEPRGRAA
jgi:capsule polysaccharide export protein KpsE/RkpR